MTYERNREKNQLFNSASEPSSQRLADFLFQEGKGIFRLPEDLGSLEDVGA